MLDERAAHIILSARFIPGGRVAVTFSSGYIPTFPWRRFVVYDAAGQLLTGSFQDYAMPRAGDFCHFELANNPSLTGRNPLGVKGVGEAGTLGAIPAAVNAVNDALAQIGAPSVAPPVTPEKVWRAITAARMPANTP